MIGEGDAIAGFRLTNVAAGSAATLGGNRQSKMRQYVWFRRGLAVVVMG